MKKYLLATSILSADFARLGEDTARVISAGADIVHFDVMDNHYVPHLTIGPIVLKSLRRYSIIAPIDVHLMVKPIDRMIIEFATAGANYITFHPEATNNIEYSLQLIREHGCKAGLALNPTTPLSCLEDILGKLDVILLMSVNPGLSGQSFLPSTVNKLYQARRMIDKSGYNIRLEVDGGIKVDNIITIAAAGADIFVIGSAIFSQQDYQAIINKIWRKLEKNFCQ